MKTTQANLIDSSVHMKPSFATKSHTVLSSTNQIKLQGKNKRILTIAPKILGNHSTFFMWISYRLYGQLKGIQLLVNNRFVYTNYISLYKLH